MSAELIVLSDRSDDLAETINVVQDVGLVARPLKTPAVAERARKECRRAQRLVLYLTEQDNLDEVRRVLSSTSASVLLVAPRSVRGRELSGLADQFGAMLCGRDDPAAVRQAMLIALASGLHDQEAS
jgi:hypothetical protein